MKKYPIKIVGYRVFLYPWLSFRQHNTLTEDIFEMLSLSSCQIKGVYVSENLCMINPTFGTASQIVGGADADIVIDDNIIDIKTTKKLEFRLRDFQQVMGYYVLHQIDGLGRLQPKPEIKKVSIYFSSLRI